MRAADLSEALRRSWRGLRFDQRVIAVAAGALILSAAGPFSWVEAAEIVVALAVLAMLQRRSQGRAFQLPLGDGGATALAGGWCALLVLARVLERTPSQTAVALACALAMTIAGLRQRARRRPERGTKPS